MQTCVRVRRMGWGRRGKEGKGGGGLGVAFFRGVLSIDLEGAATVTGGGAACG